MELDVRLVRHRDGFRIVGVDECELSLSEKMGSYSPVNCNFNMKRGLYDPVLDDSDVIYEPLDQEDFDQPSQPTEVDLPEFIDSLDILNGIPPILDKQHESYSELRSLTNSPFVCPTKPYRPFSTTPVPEIPPLEDPILLNLEYQDVFEELGIDEDLLPKTKFKLPISDQYDPDGKKQKVKVDVTSESIKQEGKNETCTSETQKETFEKRKEFLFQETNQYKEQTKKGINLDHIEQTATSIVEESIQKAVIVAEEIKKEIDVALHESTINSFETVDSKLSEKSKQILERSSKVVDSNQENKVSESVKVTDKNSVKMGQDESKINIKATKDKFESINNQQKEVSDTKVSAKQEIEETIQAGTVKNKASVFGKVTDTKATGNNNIQNKSAEQCKFKDAETKQKETKESSTKTKSKTTRSSTQNGGTKTKTSTKASQERAYVIGLQTIPNIRGSIHSNYHYDMLLKTFFIHLTDVMVALSRFILTDPAHFKIPDDLGKSQKEEPEEGEEEEDQAEDELREEVVTETVSEHQEETICKDTLKFKDSTDVREQAIDSTVASQSVQETLDSVTLTSEEVHENRHHLSGSEMAQMTEHKSEELIHKLGAVINEFQTKTGLEETEFGDIRAADRRSRSRSRSQAKEIIRQVEPSVLATTVIEAASKSHEIKETNTSNKVSSSFESQDVNIFESKRSENVESKDAKSYIAIVEAHVYTNKELLQEHLTEFSQESSIQSAQITNTAVITNEAMSTENVTLKDVESKKEIVNSTVVENQDLHVAKSKDSFQVYNKIETTNKVNDENAFLDKASSKIESRDIVNSEATVQVFNQTESTNKVDTQVFLDKTSTKIESDMIIENKPILAQAKLVKPMQKARIVKGILKVAKDESKSEALKEVNQIDVKSVEQVAEEKTSVALISEIEAEIQKTDIVAQDENVIAVQKESTVSKNIDKRTTEISSSMMTCVEESKTSVIQSKDTKTIDVKSESLNNFIDQKEIKSDVSINRFEAKTKQQDESAALKITKEKVNDMQQVTKQMDVLRNNNVSQEKNKIMEISQEVTSSLQVLESQKQSGETIIVQSFESQNLDQECSFLAKTVDQEATFSIKTVETEKIENHTSIIAKSVEENIKNDRKNLTLKTDIPLKKLDSQSSVCSEIDTPTPATIPPTPLTDEYMFKLSIPLPPKPLVPIPRDCTPSDSDDEDPNIVKKNLVPHIETKIEESIVYDTPLKSPPGTPGSPTKATPVYTKPGLRGGGGRTEKKKEEILEIERKSSLLASAIDQTIKSIEEYNEEVSLKQKGIKQKHNETYNSVIKELEETKGQKVVDMNFDEQFKVSENMPLKTNEVKKDALEGFRPVQFHPEELQKGRKELKSAMVSNGQILQNQKVRQPYQSESGEMLGTHQGIVDGLDQAYVDAKIAKELGKAGMSEEKIAELISGESEMLREAHVMGLCRVLSTKMHRPGDDSSVDFKKIKPIIESLKDSEVLKALNEELMRTKEEKKKEERRWTTFMQKPQRPVPRAKFGYHGYTEKEEVEEPYKVKIVKQPKPKVAPDYKPEVFETGLLPWEERALREPTPPPVEPEEPILVPEEEPEILEAVDPLPESEVPDLEDSGIPLPPPTPEEDPQEDLEEDGAVDIEELDLEEVVEETEKIVEENLVEEMERGNVAEQLMASVQNMVDPNAPLEQQLSQMRAQLAALAQLPCVIQQSLEMVTRQLTQLTQLESQVKATTAENASEETKEDSQEIQNTEVEQDQKENEENIEEVTTKEESQTPEVKTLSSEEMERLRREEEEMLEEQRKIEKQKKELMEQARMEHESRQVSTHPTPRVGNPTPRVGKRPTPAFGPACPVERPVVLPGGRRWRKPQDAYNEQFIAETLAAQAEIIKGKAKGLSYESVLLPYDESGEKKMEPIKRIKVRDIKTSSPYILACRSMIKCNGAVEFFSVIRINFMKYEKPPVSLDHLQASETYKLIHNMEGPPQRRVEKLTQQICEADYREMCRSMTPCSERMAKEEHLDYPQQVQP